MPWTRAGVGVKVVLRADLQSASDAEPVRVDKFFYTEGVGGSSSIDREKWEEAVMGLFDVLDADGDGCIVLEERKPAGATSDATDALSQAESDLDSVVDRDPSAIRLQHGELRNGSPQHAETEPASPSNRYFQSHWLAICGVGSLRLALGNALAAEMERRGISRLSFVSGCIQEAFRNHGSLEMKARAVWAELADSSEELAVAFELLVDCVGVGIALQGVMCALAGDDEGIDWQNLVPFLTTLGIITRKTMMDMLPDERSTMSQDETLLFDTLFRGEQVSVQEFKQLMMGAHATWERVRAGDKVLGTNERGKKLKVLVSGECYIAGSGGFRPENLKSMAVLEPGAFLGEAEFLAAIGAGSWCEVDWESEAGSWCGVDWESMATWEEFGTSLLGDDTFLAVSGGNPFFSMRHSIWVAKTDTLVVSWDLEALVLYIQAREKLGLIMCRLMHTSLMQAATQMQASKQERLKQLDEAFETIVTSSTIHFGVERASLFLVDDASPAKEDHFLWTRVATGLSGKIRVPLNGKSIAASAARQNDIILIPDCYSDPRFDTYLDSKTGFRTRSMLCCPIRHPDDASSVIGVIQLMNKIGKEPFGDKDRRLVAVLSEHASLLLRPVCDGRHVLPSSMPG